MEVQAPSIVEGMNTLGKQGWEVFHVMPVYALKTQNDESELVPKAYHIFARRPLAEGK
jgi:hypothetical protein